MLSTPLAPVFCMARPLNSPELARSALSANHPKQAMAFPKESLVSRQTNVGSVTFHSSDIARSRSLVPFGSGSIDRLTELEGHTRLSLLDYTHPRSGRSRPATQLYNEPPADLGLHHHLPLFLALSGFVWLCLALALALATKHESIPPRLLAELRGHATQERRWNAVAAFWGTCTLPCLALPCLPACFQGL